MTKREKAVKELEQVPDVFLDEAVEFIRYLKGRAVTEQIGTYIASEPSLKKDWLRPEEDAAWENL